MYDMIYKNRYIWNKAKAEANYQKHGIHFEQASDVFEDLFAIDEYDEEHSDYEDRFLIVGRAETLIAVSFTIRDDDTPPQAGYRRWRGNLLYWRGTYPAFQSINKDFFSQKS